ncbi:MAG: hypothetical protein CMF72_19650 [Mameliella sp.]|nr:hypothetical protein [Mameliella sp.]|tara:strand:+ start:407 stop:1219 length:813 start_codon:yes stop_codon:yes gene_type:complete
MTLSYTAILERPDDSALTYDVEGNGPPLVLISGLGGTSAFWKPFAGLLSDRFTVLSYDHAGIARSTRGNAPANIDRFSEDVKALAETAFPGQPVAVFGHSMGGIIAQNLAAKEPNLVSRVILSGTWLQADDFMRAQFALRRALIEQAPGLYSGFQRLISRSPDLEPPDAGVWEGLIQDVPGMTAAEVANFNDRAEVILQFSGKALAPGLTMPCLVLGARDDHVVPFRNQSAVHAAIPGSALKTMDYGGHFYPNSQAETTAQYVLEWLDSN